MDQDNSRGHQHYNPNMRMGDRSIPSNYGSIPPLPNNMLPYSYMYSGMPPLYYPGYPYSAYQYPSSSYLPTNGSQWRDSPYAPGVLGANPNYPRSFGIQQNSRVTPRDLRDRQEHEVINL